MCAVDGQGGRGEKKELSSGSPAMVARWPGRAARRREATGGGGATEPGPEELKRKKRKNDLGFQGEGRPTRFCSGEMDGRP